MENVKKYFGVGDEVLPWAFYRIIEIEHLKAHLMRTIAKGHRDD